MKVLFIDLDKLESKIEYVNYKTFDYAVFLHKDIYKTYEKEAFNENNIVIFFLGHYVNEETINGLYLYKSPTTNTLEINLSKHLGKYLKLADLDLIAIKGKSKKKYFLIIENDNVVFLEDEITENIFDKYNNYYNTIKDIYGNNEFTILLNGLGSKYTEYGNLIMFEKNKMHILKGSVGSVLYKAHNITGISIGGGSEIDGDILYLDLNLEKGFHENIVDIYNYYKGEIPIMNFQNIYLKKEYRHKIFEEFILPIINESKFPFIPFNQYGPFLGIFDKKLIEELVYLINSYGLDTIYTSFILGGVIEGIYNNNISLETNYRPVFDIKKVDFSISENNYNVAKYLIENIAIGRLSNLGYNIKIVGTKFSIKDYLFYIPMGENYGSIIDPYLSLGLILPNLINDKYFSYHLLYSYSPEEMANMNFSKLKYTYTINNVGRTKIINNYYHRDSLVDIYEYSKRSNSLPNYYESKRSLDTYNYILRRDNITIEPSYYWNKYYQLYKEYIYYSKASVV